LVPIVEIEGDSALFPGDACVHCLSPTAHRVELLKVKHSAVRRVSVPLCERCAAAREAKSLLQMRFERTAAAAGFFIAWGVGVWVYLAALSWHATQVERGPLWSALLGFLAVECVFGVLYLIGRRWSLHYRSDETKAVLASVRIHDFDWDTTSLEFADPAYAERFARANQRHGAASTSTETGGPTGLHG
jgi:hypothetical protein